MIRKDIKSKYPKSLSECSDEEMVGYISKALTEDSVNKSNVSTITDSELKAIIREAIATSEGGEKTVEMYNLKIEKLLASLSSSKPALCAAIGLGKEQWVKSGNVASLQKLNRELQDL